MAEGAVSGELRESSGAPADAHPRRARRWRVCAERPEETRALAAAVGVSELMARLLLNRGIETEEAAQAFLGARLSEHLRSPMLFRDMGRAAERVIEAVRRGERVGIYGDYDVDGISGSALLVRFLRSLGSEALLHVPHRMREGYGLNELGIRKLAEQGARVMITVDCGGVSHREIALANDLGMDVIVCDHHQVSGTPLPAFAVLNPIEPDAGFPFRGLCGAGVAFYLALGVRMRLRERGEGNLPDLRRQLDLVALGTIADMVPLVEENRVLVKHGLRELTRSQKPGIGALKAVSGVAEVSSFAVGFRLGPRLNAGGRLADATRSVELLTTDDHDRAAQLAAGLDEENRARQSIEREMLDEAIAMVEQSGVRHGIVVASESFHPGVVGIVASRLVERFYRPTVVIAIDRGRDLARGSGRSIRGFDLYAAIKSCGECLDAFGGHRMAAGLSIRPAQIASFQQRFDAAVESRTCADDFVPVTEVDAALAFPAIDEGCLEAIERLEPCGMANREPLFLARDARVASRRIVGESHLKLQLEQGGRILPAIGFGMADLPVSEGTHLDVLFTPMASEWGMARTIELRLRDLRSRR